MTPRERAMADLTQLTEDALCNEWTRYPLNALENCELEAFAAEFDRRAATNPDAWRRGLAERARDELERRKPPAWWPEELRKE